MGNDKRMKKKKGNNKAFFFVGLFLCFFSAGLMIVDIFHLSFRITLGIVGISLIAISGYRLIR